MTEELYAYAWIYENGKYYAVKAYASGGHAPVTMLTAPYSTQALAQKTADIANEWDGISLERADHIIAASMFPDSVYGKEYRETGTIL